MKARPAACLTRTSSRNRRRSTTSGCERLPYAAVATKHPPPGAGFGISADPPRPDPRPASSGILGRGRLRDLRLPDRLAVLIGLKDRFPVDLLLNQDLPVRVGEVLRQKDHFLIVAVDRDVPDRKADADIGRVRVEDVRAMARAFHEPVVHAVRLAGVQAPR